MQDAMFNGVGQKTVFTVRCGGQTSMVGENIGTRVRLVAAWSFLDFRMYPA